MRLVYGSQAFKGILHELKKQDITEEGIELNYQFFPKESIILGDKDKRTVYLNTSKAFALAQLKHFMIEKKNPGFLFISAKCDLHKGEIMNRILLNRVLPLQKVILLGQHKYSKSELDFIHNNKLNFFSMKEVSFEGYFEISDAVMSIAKEFSDLYVLIDTSVLDKSIILNGAPGGMSVRELLFFIHRLKQLKSFRYAEVILPPNYRSLGAKILSQLYI